MTLTATVGGTAINLFEGTWKTSDKIDQQGQCGFTIIDTTGTVSFSKYQPVSIVDSVLGTQFTGIVDKAKATKLYPNPHRMWAITCTDQTNLANRRTSKKKYANQFAGTIVADQIQRYLAPEGVTGAFALDWDELLTEWQAGTLTNVSATTNAGDGNPGDGDLELALAGSAVSFSQASQSDFNAGTTGLGLTSPASGGVTFTPTQAIKFQATESINGLSNAYTYVKIWGAGYTIASGDTLFYDVWIADSSPEIKASVDFVLSDGTTLRDNQSVVGTDVQGIGPHPSNDLSGLATNTWYSRRFFLDGGGAWVGKTISYVTVAFEGESQGTYTAYFRNVWIKNGGTTKATIFGSNATATAIVPQQMQNSGYSNMSCSVVTSYERHGAMYSPYFSTAGAGIVRSSSVGWKITLPNSNFTFTITASIDHFATFLPCTQNSSIPDLLPGQNTTGKDVIFVYVFDNAGNDPTLTPVLSKVAGAVQPSYVCAKSDSITKYNAQADWNTGTKANLTAPGGAVLQLNGAAHNWDDADYSNQTLYGGGGGGQGVKNQQFFLSCNAAGEMRSRMDFAGQWADATMEFDVTIDTANIKYGCVYRTAGWVNTDGAFAYCVEITTTSMKLFKGTDGGANSITQIGPTVTLALSSGGIHRIKVVFNGSSHKVYLDDVLSINQTDGTYTGAGYVGLRQSNSSAATCTAIFDNFGVVAALSGTWVSPAIDIHSLGTISNSELSLQIDPGLNTTICTFLVEISLNNGGSWTTCPNAQTTAGYYYTYQVPGLTPGTNVSGLTQIKLRITISATTAATGSSMPDVTAITLTVLGAYSSSGTRVSPALSLANVLPRVGTALVNWNDIQPTNTNVAVATSIDGKVTWQGVAAPGNGISGITVQPAPYVDGFDTNTSASYTATHLSGTGTNASWNWDTANSRLIGTQSSGFRGVLQYTTLSFADGYVDGDFDKSDTGGLIIRMTGSNNAYYLVIRDASANSGTQNTATLNKIVGGTITQLAQVAISFPRGTYHHFHLKALGTALSVSMDGLQIISQTDSSLGAAGNAGVLCATAAGGVVELYSLRIQQYGDDVSAKTVYTRVTLTSTDPTVTPQVLDLQCFVASPSIGAGILMPSTNYVDTFVGSNILDLTTQSNYWSSFDVNKAVTFQARNATPAPWLIASVNQSVNVGGQNIGDVLVDSLSLEPNGDLYRNRQTIKGAIDTGTFTEVKAGDGTTQSWNVSYPLTAAPTILLNGQTQTVGVKGVDTGKQSYYQVGSTSIDQDSSGTVLQALVDQLSITYTGSFEVDVTIDNTGVNNPSALPYPTVLLPGTTTQAQIAALDSSSGIIESVYDATGQGVTKAAATTLATQWLQRYGLKDGRTLTFKTLRSGLVPGQQLTAFVPEHNCMDVQFLVVQVDQTITTLAGGVQQFFYQVVAMEGANLGNWVRIFSSLLSR